jgi:hypothetical protein
MRQCYKDIFCACAVDENQIISHRSTQHLRKKRGDDVLPISDVISNLIKSLKKVEPVQSIAKPVNNSLLN